MTKVDLIKEICAITEVDSASTAQVVESFMKLVKECVAGGEDVTLRGFGTFKNVLRHERNFNYVPGKRRLIPEHYEVVLKFCKEVKEVVK